MSERVPPSAGHAPSAARNRAPILEILKPRLPAQGLVLEIASGTGEHAVHFAASLPGLQWQPSDASAAALDSIAAWRDHAGLSNVRPPILLDVTASTAWPVARADAVVSINMIHIAPWEATLGLMAGASRLLPPTGLLYLYGPYFELGVDPAPSNLAFDVSLKERHPDWGIRQLDAVAAAALSQGLHLHERLPMPANNLSLVFRKA